MKINEKIMMLRKQKNWSQEELAFKLNVSRQAVSKWETGEAVPELDKIVTLSELFDVSLDYLIKDNGFDENKETKKNNIDSKVVIKDDAYRFLNMSKYCAKLISLGVSLLLFALIIPTIVYGVMELDGSNRTGVLVFTILMIFILVAIAIGLFIFTGAKFKEFESYMTEGIYLNESLKTDLKHQSKQKEGLYLTGLITGVIILIIGVAPLITISLLEMEDRYVFLGLTILFLAVAIALPVLIISQLGKTGYDILLQEGNYSVDKKMQAQNSSVVLSVYWLLVTGTYLAVSFLTRKWGITWVIWPVAGVVGSAIAKIIHAKKSK